MGGGKREREGRRIERGREKERLLFPRRSFRNPFMALPVVIGGERETLAHTEQRSAMPPAADTA